LFKKENLFLSNKEELEKIKIGDFGLSFQFEKAGNFHKLISKRCGTFLFMAPE
jgi:serine/threonine protein kinase